MPVPSLASSAGSSLARTSCNVALWWQVCFNLLLWPWLVNLLLFGLPFFVFLNSPLVSPSFYPVLLASPLNVAEFAQSLLGNLIQETILYVINRLQHSFL